MVTGYFNYTIIANFAYRIYSPAKITLWVTGRSCATSRRSRLHKLIVMNEKDIRWKQRFENFSKAFNQFEEAIKAYANLSDLEKEGLVQRYEYTFELAWKTLKDYLESKGVVVSFPRDVLKEAFAAQVIQDGEIWIEMLNSRNLMAHTYEEAIFNQVVDNINKKYYPAIVQLVNYLQNQDD
jgi:nucleotidyltransferase substrate binding protein (TIGR01987 family)